MNLLSLLFPREKKFYAMLEHQVAFVKEGVDDFHALITHYGRLSAKERKRLISKIRLCEREDDRLYTEMVRALKSTFITPMDREDIHQLVTIFDTIIDTVELLTLKLDAFGIKKIDTHLARQIKLFHEAFGYIEKLIHSIQKEAHVELYCKKIRAIEQKADEEYINALESLFADSVKPAIIIKYNDLYSSLETMIDRVNDASFIIESIVVKYS